MGKEEGRTSHCDELWLTKLRVLGWEKDDKEEEDHKEHSQAAPLHEILLSSAGVTDLGLVESSSFQVLLGGDVFHEGMLLATRLLANSTSAVGQVGTSIAGLCPVGVCQVLKTFRAEVLRAGVDEAL